MGEFSSGKSTLANLLLGAEPLPTKVTATQLPPVWIAAGDAADFYEDQAGRQVPFARSEWAEIDLEDTLVVRLFMQSDLLELCDLIDMPGISDPNMASEVWERLVEELDCVIWCTPANQSWRQSEAAVWETFPAELQARSLLLATQRDKLKSDDLAKVEKRLSREAGAHFAGVHSISVTQALAAEEDEILWERSGADGVVNHLLDLLSGTPDPMVARLERQARPEQAPAPAPTPMTRPSPKARTTRPPRETAQDKVREMRDEMKAICGTTGRS